MQIPKKASKIEIGSPAPSHSLWDVKAIREQLPKGIRAY
jgi:hypothetical protein